MGRHSEEIDFELRIAQNLIKARIGLRDITAADAARELLTTADPHQEWGQLGTLGVWLSGANGQCPPRPLADVRLLSFGPTDVAALLAQAHGVQQIPVQVPPETDPNEAFAWGRQLADQAIDAGADALLTVGPQDLVATGALTAILQHLTAVEVVGFDGLSSPQPGDTRWTECVKSIRDLVYLAGRQKNTSEVLTLVNSPEAIVITGLLLQAATRRTPVLLDGGLPLACALAAKSIADDASHWWLLATRPKHPMGVAATRTLLLDPIMDLDLGITDGTAALLALPILRAAQALFADAIDQVDRQWDWATPPTPTPSPNPDAFD